jgi:hypothetical protein
MFFLPATLKQWPEMFESLASCFALRCGAPLNMERLDCGD